MASFHAELHLGGSTFRVVHCQFACSQATDMRGRVSAKVRHHLLELTLDVPTNDTLLDWAATSHKPQAGQVVFHDKTQLVAHETIAFTDGECVGYTELFESGAGSDGAYVCQLTIAASEFELRGGGPTLEAGQAVEAALSAGQQAAPAAVAQQLMARETPSDGAQSSSNHFGRDMGAALSPALASMLDSILLVAPTAGPNGPADFAAATRADLQAIYNTPTGKQLLDSLAAAGRKIYINYGEQNQAGFPFNPKPAFYEADGITPGQGLALTIEYNPFIEKTGPKPWNERPPAIGLAHELIHAEQAAHGRMLRSLAPNPGGPDPANPHKQDPTYEFELQAVGVPPYDTYPVSENKIRAEWNPPQTRRAYY